MPNVRYIAQSRVMVLGGDEGTMASKASRVSKTRERLTTLGCKVLSATMAHSREALGDAFELWHREAGYPEIDRIDVLQSSDSEYHCVTFVIWYRKDL
jgi:hypothetical protein